MDLASQHVGAESEDESDGEDLFQPRARDEAASNVGLESIDAMDCSRLLYSANALAALDDPEAQQSLRNRFVTGRLPQPNWTFLVCIMLLSALGFIACHDWVRVCPATNHAALSL